MLKDETGNRYGRLTVLRRYDHTAHSGQEVAILGAKLRNGNTRSCGCLARMGPLERITMGYYPHGKERVIVNG
jgi:hypothetical protein